MQNLKGAMTALVTPIKNDKLDTSTYAKLIKRQIAQGIDVVVPVGTTGESATLSHNEHKECIEIAIEVCKNTKTKVIAGAGSNSTKEAIDLALFAQNAGANGILSVTPYYNKPTQEGLYQHYKSIAQNIEIPVMLYNVPSRTGVGLDTSTIARLFNDVKNIYAIKEATGNIGKSIEILNQIPDIVVISGDDAIDAPMMGIGGSGSISVTANLMPNLKSDLIHKALDGDLQGANKINDKLYPLNQVLFCESNPIPIKAAMFIAGLIETLEYRLPLTAPSKEHLKQIENVMKNYEIIL